MPNYKSMLETRICAACGSRFQAPSYVDIKFCSAACEKAARKAVYEKECLICKSPFRTNRPDIMYCSKTCSEKSKLLYEKSEARKKYRHDYRQRLEVKAKKAKSDATPAVLQRKKDYAKKPEAKEQKNKRRRTQYKIPAVRQSIRTYQSGWYKKRHPRR